MDRASYNRCMGPYMAGKTNAAERQAAMCIGAKLCTGKALDERAAQKLCDEAALLPKKPKPIRKNCANNMIALAKCLGGKITGETSVEDLHKYLVECACGGLVSKAKIKRAAIELNPDHKQALDTLAQMALEYGTKV